MSQKMAENGYEYLYKGGKQVVKGQGEFGKAVLVVDKCQDIFISKEVDMKGMSASARMKAKKEVQVLCKLEHPNIVHLYDFWEEDEKLFIIMEYANGGTLSSRVQNLRSWGKGDGFEEDVLIVWFVQLLLALQYLHSRNVLHRDLKADNIFLTVDNIIKLGDFGVSVELSGTLASAQTLCGTPYYFSPELCNGVPYTSKADVWALGCISHLLATLRYPFEGRDLKELMKNIRSNPAPSLPNEYSPEFRDLVSRMLQKDPNDRPTINEILLAPFLQTHLTSITEKLKILQELQTGPSCTAQVLHPISPLPARSTPAVARSLDKMNFGNDRKSMKEFLSGPPPAEVAALPAENDSQLSTNRIDSIAESVDSTAATDTTLDSSWEEYDSPVERSVERRKKDHSLIASYVESFMSGSLAAPEGLHDIECFGSLSVLCPDLESSMRGN